jgi:hypothetical protein
MGRKSFAIREPAVTNVKFKFIAIKRRAGAICGMLGVKRGISVAHSIESQSELIDIASAIKLVADDSSGATILK